MEEILREIVNRIMKEILSIIPTNLIIKVLEYKINYVKLNLYMYVYTYCYIYAFLSDESLFT